MTGSPHKILIHEYFTGGGWSAPDMPSDLVSEGLAMLCAVLDDFNKWGKAKVYTTLDRRLSGTPVTVDNIRIIDPDKYEKTLSGLAKECDFALVIAPESDSILARLNKQLKQWGTALLGCEENAIRITGDKWRCHKLLTQAGLPVPETVCVGRHSPLETAQKINFPLVIKPVDGVGCEGVNLVRERNSLREVLEYNSEYNHKMLFQEHIKGEHLSASILSNGKEFVFLSLNRQHIDEGVPFKYKGGEIMPPPDKDDPLHRIIEKILKVIPGLKGYFGVDLIRSEAGYKIIEINPRLTTSYVGLRQVININLAEAMFDAVVKGILPEHGQIRRNMEFSKEKQVYYTL